MSPSTVHPTAAETTNGTAVPLPILWLIAAGLCFPLVGVAVFSWGLPQPSILHHCWLGLGMQSLAVGLVWRRKTDFALLLTGLALAWIALLTPRFGSGSLLFLLGLIQPFLVLLMTRWPLRLRLLLALAPPAVFVALRIPSHVPVNTGLLTPSQLHHLATVNVLFFLLASMGTSVYMLRVAETARRRAEQLAETNSRLLDDMSHELRTPATTVLTAAQAALTRERSGAAYRESLQVIERQARTLRRLLHRMLEVGRAERGEVTIEPVDALEPAVRQVVDSYRSAAAEASVELELETKPVDTLTDATVLHIVLGNLLSNAIRYCPAGGRVHIRLDAPQALPRLQVQDDGPGIAAEDLPYLFDRYWRADRSRTRRDSDDRLGLGLTIARLYARLLGADIEAESRPSRGAVFTLRWRHPPELHPGHQIKRGADLR